MSDFSKTLGKWSSIPWRPCLIVVGASFLIASVLNTMVAHLFLTKEAKGGAGKPGVTTAALGPAFSVPTPAASLSQNGVDLILKRNIFNSEGAATDDTKKTDDDKGPKTLEAVKSDLPVKLIGTIYGGDPLSGIALVENSTKKTINSFMVGDTLTKESIVKEVLKERIIIDREGRLEYIEVDKQELSRSKRKKKSKDTSSSNNTTIAPIATEPPPSSYKEDGFERKEREMVMTSAYKQKLLTGDFTKVLQDAKASPNMVDGELKGFLLTRIRKDSIYEKAGLQNEDIVSEINGIPLTDTAQAIRLLQSLRNEAEIEIRILRGGAPMNFTMNVK